MSLKDITEDKNYGLDSYILCPVLEAMHLCIITAGKRKAGGYFCSHVLFVRVEFFLNSKEGKKQSTVVNIHRDKQLQTCFHILNNYF